MLFARLGGFCGLVAGWVYRLACSGWFLSDQICGWVSIDRLVVWFCCCLAGCGGLIHGFLPIVSGSCCFCV